MTKTKFEAAVEGFVDNSLSHLVEWLVRFAELLLLAAAFAFAAFRTQSWILGGLVALLFLVIFAHSVLGLRALQKRAVGWAEGIDPNGEDVEIHWAVKWAVTILISALVFAMGFASSVAVVWAVYQIAMTNTS